MRGWRNIYHGNGHQKKAGVPILISDKLDFKTKTVVRDEEEHYIIIKGVYPTRKSNNYKYLCPQLESSQIYKSITNLKKLIHRDAWEAQSVKHLPLVQVMISVS